MALELEYSDFIFIRVPYRNPVWSHEKMKRLRTEREQVPGTALINMVSEQTTTLHVGDDPIGVIPSVILALKHCWPNSQIS
jgi:hypothetical protein